jgi:hypothetical protein
MSGSAILSEAMLTGESAPVMKGTLPANDPTTTFRPDTERDKKYMLFSGTQVGGKPHAKPYHRLQLLACAPSPVTSERGNKN